MNRETKKTFCEKKLTGVCVAGFERGKEDLLSLPLKEDSHSISKSKVREKKKYSSEMWCDVKKQLGAWCNETRECGN